jgi:hypothetical protein
MARLEGAAFVTPRRPAFIAKSTRPTPPDPANLSPHLFEIALLQGATDGADSAEEDNDEVESKPRPNIVVTSTHEKARSVAPGFSITGRLPAHQPP